MLHSLRRARQETGPLTAENIIEIRDAWFEYEGGIQALRGVSLDIAQGDWVAVIGQNGSGKTTLVKHFNGLFKPARGQVRVGGRDTARLTVADLARTVGYVFQNPDHQIFSVTVRDEIAFGPRNLGLAGSELDERVQQALDLFGLGPCAGSPPAVLGYGIRRKISLAAVYAMRPRVFVLDEPTTGLDWKSTRDLMQLVQRMNEAGHTIVLVTHDMKLVGEYARTCLVMHEGQVLARGETRQVFRQDAALQAARLELPQIAQLARQMQPGGLPQDVLTVSEFFDAYTARTGSRP